MPTRVKVAIDAWTARAGVTDGHIFWLIHRGDELHGERLSEKVCGNSCGRTRRLLAWPESRRTTTKLRRAAGGELEQIQLLLGHA